MFILTSKLLDNFSLSQYADPRSIQRGRAYYDEGRVFDIDLKGDQSKAVCVVDGDSGEYTVEIAVDLKSGQLEFDCDCPYAEEHFCKHMVAAILELKEYLREDEDAADEEDEYFVPQHNPNWQSKLDQVLAQLPRSSSQTGANIQRYAAVLLISKEEYYAYGSFSLTAYIIKARNWNTLLEMIHADKQSINDLLDKDHEWIKYGEIQFSEVNPAGCLNLSSEAITFFNFIQQYTHVFGGASSFAGYLPVIAQMQIPVFAANQYKKNVKNRIQILPNPVDVQVTFTQGQGNLTLQANVMSDTPLPVEGKVEVISYNPPWIMAGNTVFTLRNPAHLALFSSFPIVIPEKQADLFREKYLRHVAERFPIQSELIHWHEIQTNPTPRLYLHDDKDDILRASLRFGYAEQELPASKSNEPITVKTIPDGWDLIRVHRKLTDEQAFYQLLTDPAYGIKRSNSYQPFGTFELRSRTHPFDFLMHSVPRLTQAGFEIYGEENLKLGKVNRSTPTLRVNITSGIDWFDLKAFIEYGDQQVSLQDVRRALKRGEHYVKLADGSAGQIPEEWLEKYKHLWNLAEETESGFRISDFHLPLIDSLLEGNPALQIPADLQLRRQRLHSFEHIVSQPLPSGLTGELRPYQKHGFDWLHFLFEYKFGGILADDMGLGKTVQVLAYLLSLREQSKVQNAALLVVPKSLIANWQRESEKFTPNLRFLEYMGNLRPKDTTVFDDYDIVLTTYGTMLHDIEILRGYKFHHVILDESQAIKNPLAKSSKAARLLSADHRLVMTGTPVENNTFELWSQFAFLNPGLLGGMDYFRREFANPIESGGDESATTLLRKLVYPFILRRTKEQVAPELPSRTERIVYTDMEPAQKKFYAQTRERYRAELLGLIESDGIADARFKILEGLLRLRQIAIHPGLVEKNYRGDAPKFDVLLETLETLQSEGHKALVFSQFVETLKLVRRVLDERKIKYVYLDGRTKDRQKIVDIFQNDASFPFFLISLKAGGVGLNLTAADYVIHIDPWWNPAVEMQASDRAHRIGQDKPVFIYKIITRDTVEEKILQLQERKRALVQSIIASEASFFKSLTKDDVKVLFS
ncbi:MAG: SNF2-related protein [Anaerolineales bacterium]